MAGRRFRVRGQDGDVRARLVVDGEVGSPSESGRAEGRRGLLELLDGLRLDSGRRAEVERLLDGES